MIEDILIFSQFITSFILLAGTFDVTEAVLV